MLRYATTNEEHTAEGTELGPHVPLHSVAGIPGTPVVKNLDICTDTRERGIDGHLNPTSIGVRRVLGVVKDHHVDVSCAVFDEDERVLVGRVAPR